MYKTPVLLALIILMACEAVCRGLESPSREDKLDFLLGLLEKPEPFQPLTEADVKAGRASLDRSLQVLDRQLQGLGADQERLWKTYLHWDELQGLLQEERPSRSGLIRIAQRYQMNHPGLEMKVFTDVRSGIVDYANLNYFSSESVAQRVYETRLRLIRTSLEKLKEGTDDRTIGLLGEAVSDLENSGNCPNLVKQIRTAFAKPNFHFEVSESLARRVLKDRRAVDSRPVFEEILGVLQRGTAHTTSRFDVDFLPSRQSGRFKLRIDGDVISDQVGTKELGLLGNVYLCTEGNTCLVGEAVIEFDGKRLSYSDIAAGARTRSTLKGVGTPPLLQGATISQYERKKAEGEAEAASRARLKLIREMKSQLNTTLAEANQKLKSGVGTTVKRLDFEPKRFEVSTSDDAFRVLAIIGNRQQLTSLEGPDATTGSDIITQLHESTINNGLQHLLGGRTVKMEELRQMIESFGVELPPPPEDEKPLTITFPRVRPVQVLFDDQKVTTIISASEIESGGTEVKDNLTITITYAVESTPDSVRVTLVDEARIDFEGVYTNSKSVIESVIKPRLEKAVKKETREFSLDELEIPEEFREIGVPVLSQLKIQNGWLVAEMGIEKERMARRPLRKKLSANGVIRRIQSDGHGDALSSPFRQAAYVSLSD